MRRDCRWFGRLVLTWKTSADWVEAGTVAPELVTFVAPHAWTASVALASAVGGKVSMPAHASAAIKPMLVGLAKSNRLLSYLMRLPAWSQR